MDSSRHGSVSLLSVLAVLAAGGFPARGDPEAVTPGPLTPASMQRIEELEQRITDLVARGAYAEANPAAEEVASLRAKEQGAGWWETTDARLRVQLLEQVCGLTRQGQDEFDDLTAAGERVVELHDQGNVREALRAAKAREAALSKLLGSDGQEALRARAQVAQLLTTTGAYTAAEALHRDLLAARRLLFGGDHPEVGESLNDLGVSLYFQGKYDEAEAAYGEALEVRRRARGDAHMDVAQSSNNLAASYVARGRYEAAEPLYVQAMTTWKAALGPRNAEVAHALNNLGTLRRYQGDYRRAELLYRECLEIRREVLDPGSVEIGISLNNLASMLQARGDYAAAAPLYREALENLHSSLGPNHSYTASVLNNLAMLLKDRGSHGESEGLYREALAVRRAKLGGKHPLVAESLNNLGRLLKLRKGYDEAEAAYREALSIWTAAYGDSHPHIAEGLTNLGAMLTEMGRYEEADGLLQRGLAMRRELEGARHPRAAASLFQLGELQRRRGALEEAEASLREAMSVVLSVRPRIASDEKGRAAFAGAARLPEVTAALADTLVRLGKPEDAFEVLERGRSRAVLDLLSRSDRDLIAEAGARHGEAASAVLGKLLEREASARAALGEQEARLASRGFGTAVAAHAAADGPAAVGAARRAVEAAEAAVLAKLLDVWPEAQPLGAAAIREALEPGEVILTFNWTRTAVCILVVPSGVTESVTARIVAEGSERAAELEDLAGRTRSAIQTHGASPGGDIGGELWERLFPADVRALLLSSRRLIVVPDGPLRYLPLSALAVGDPATGPRSRLLDAGPPIVYADSGTVFVNRRRVRRAQPDNAPAGGWSALIVADPRFDEGGPGRGALRGTPAGAESSAAGSRSADEEAAEVSALDQIRLYGGKLRPLPGTREEARAIRRIVERAGGQVSVLAGAEASLPEVEARVAGMRFLHLATHGLAGSLGRPLDASLALARPAAPAPDDIGFLTLDHLIRSWRGKLERCELAVLSACDTRLGIERGDSDLALPWGFMYAGAPAVVASLWKVDDEATRLLMQRFYENVLGQYDGARGGHGAGTVMAKDEALQEAKRWLRGYVPPATTRLASRGGLVAAPVLVVEESGRRSFRDPYFWAGFVLLGAPD